MEFGSSHSEPLLFLHGGGLSWWNYREAAGLLAPDYHVLVPVLDGHAGSDRPFTSIEDNAAEILSWIDTHLGGHVLLIGGLSLGAQVLLSLLSLWGAWLLGRRIGGERAGLLFALLLAVCP